MSIDANAPAIIHQLAAQLDACPSWSGTNYYPAQAYESASLPAAIIDDPVSNRDTIAPGVAVISGSLSLMIYSTEDVPAIESLARALENELMAQAPGITFRSSSTGLALVARPETEAGQTAVNAIPLTFEYGLSA